MVTIKRVMLDVLKPHEPTIVDMAMEIAEQGDDYQVSIRVSEIDEKTETLELVVTGLDLDLERIETVIEELGGAVHSIDEVMVGSGPLPE